MSAKTFALFIVVNICLVNPLQLTREIVPQNVKLEEFKAQPNANLQEVIQALFENNILESLVAFVIESQSDSILKLIEKLENNNGDLVGVFNTLNEGLGANVLQVSNDTLRVDASQLESFALIQARNLAKALYPKDIFQQLVFYSVSTEQIRTVLRTIKPDLEEISVPLRVLAAVLPETQVSNLNVEARAIQNRDAINDVINVIFTLFRTPICAILSTYVTVIETTINGALTNLTALIVDPTTITNEYLQILASAFNSLLRFVEELAQYGVSAVDYAYKSTCESSSSRKRRDLSEITDVLAIEPEERSLRMKRGIFEDIQSFFLTLYTNYLAPIFNTALKALVSQAVTYVKVLADTFLNTTVLAFAYDLINNITLQA